MIRYNICFIKRGNQILLLNREKASWMGCWNGIGGKLEQSETPRESMIREMQEETGIDGYKLHFKGFITWSTSGSEPGGMYTYVAEVPEEYHYPTPIKTDEGILDWKDISWILHDHNLGIASNVTKTLSTLLNDPYIYDHHCRYENGIIQDYEAVRIDSTLEWDESSRVDYFTKYIGESGRGQSNPDILAAT